MGRHPVQVLHEVGDGRAIAVLHEKGGRVLEEEAQGVYVLLRLDWTGVVIMIL